MPVTKEKLISDIILRVCKGAPSDDLELEDAQVAFWFDIVGKKIIPDFLNKKLINGFTIDPVFIKIEDNKVMQQEDVAMLPECKDRNFITITQKPLDLYEDRGVIRIVTDEGVVVNKVAVERLDTLNAMTFGRPNKLNLLYTRVDDKIYIHGITSKATSLVEFSVYYIPTFSLTDLADTDTVKLSDELVATISDVVAEMAIKELYGGVADVENDAEDDSVK